MSNNDSKTDDDILFWRYYDPSQAAAGIFTALFAISLVVGAVQTVRQRSVIWFVMLIAVAMEAVGYIARLVSARRPTEDTPYIIQFCLIFLAPVLMAGIIYVAFGRLVFRVVPPEHRTFKLLWAPARWLTPIFVAFDIIALFTQLVGGVMLSTVDYDDPAARDTIDRGSNIALAGVTAQIVAFGLFCIIAFRFHFTSKRFMDGTQQGLFSSGKSTNMRGQQFKANWRWMLHAINFSCFLIMARSIFREVEFAMGGGSYLETVEWAQYVFDAVPMAACVWIYVVFPPGSYVSMGWRQPKDMSVLEESQDSSDPEVYAMDNRQPRY